MSLVRRACAELLGTAFLLAAVVGSGIMGERLAGGNIAVTLLANSLATGGALVALLLAFGPISGAHLNPAVTLAEALQRARPWRDFAAYVPAQLVGALLGVGIAHLMFGEPVVQVAQHVRAGPAQLLGEFVATFGLVSVVWSCARSRPDAAPLAVAAYIVAAYWFTSSTSFANPAVTLARSLTDTFAGIRPVDVAPFVVVQLLAAVSAAIVTRWLTDAHSGQLLPRPTPESGL